MKKYTLTQEDIVELNHLSSILEKIEVKGHTNVIMLASSFSILERIFGRINASEDVEEGEE